MPLCGFDSRDLDRYSTRARHPTDVPLPRDVTGHDHPAATTCVALPLFRMPYFVWFPLASSGTCQATFPGEAGAVTTI